MALGRTDYSVLTFPPAVFYAIIQKRKQTRGPARNTVTLYDHFPVYQGAGDITRNTPLGTPMIPEHGARGNKTGWNARLIES